jgi:hypothetical protein
MIRLRRIKPRFPIGRLYEVEIPNDAGVDRVVTRSPLSILDPRVGVGEAWALIDAANRLWDGDSGEWVTLYDQGSSPAE